MDIHVLNITFGSHQLTLTNQRALYWESENAIVLSDLHLGKAAHFRKHGIALPSSISEKDLNRLAQLIIHYQAEKVIIVGDLIHAGNNKEVGEFQQFTHSFPNVSFILIKGNHDRQSDEFLYELGIQSIYEHMILKDLYFTHQPRDLQSYTISGHIHPGIKFKLGNKQRLSLPCFVVKDQQLILPAFSEFSGLDTKSLPNDVTYYPFFEQGIFQL